MSKPSSLPSFVRATPILTLLFVGCGKPETISPEKPRPVYTITVEAPESTIQRSFSGLVNSAEGVGIAFEVGGRVVEVLAEEGMRYKADTVLARVDDTEYRNQMVGAEAQLTEAIQNLRRVQQLFETGNAAQGSLETSIAQEKAARSNYNSAQKRVKDSVLKMPYDGVIGEVYIDAQQVVNVGQSAMTIQGDSGIEFEIGVPAEVVANLKPGQSATIELGTFSSRQFPATVVTVSPQPGQNTTYPVTLRFEEEDDRIREGMDGEANLTLSNPEGALTTIPAVCIVAGPEDSKFVWVFEEGTVSRRDVKTGKLRGNGMIEIEEGLKKGETVISRGVHRLREGQTVRLLEP